MKDKTFILLSTAEGIVNDKRNKPYKKRYGTEKIKEEFSFIETFSDSKNDKEVIGELNDVPRSFSLFLLPRLIGIYKHQHRLYYSLYKDEIQTKEYHKKNTKDYHRDDTTDRELRVKHENLLKDLEKIILGLVYLYYPDYIGSWDKRHEYFATLSLLDKNFEKYAKDDFEIENERMEYARSKASEALTLLAKNIYQLDIF